MDPVEAYLAELSAIRGSGAAVPETSGYGALATLLNAVGHTLKPKVRCLINLANTGAGIPDGGLFVASQCEKGAGDALPGQLPARGAIEVKAASDSAAVVAQSEQVMKYLEKYRQVLVTTYREFVLVGYDADGVPATLESFSLAATETAFWVIGTTPRKAAHEQGERLTEFLKRALLRQAPIAAPQDLAWFLASYAREARARVEERVELPALAVTRTALEESLGMTFQGDRGEHFFRSTLVQTLFYGLFAAWVFWSEHHDYSDSQARFRWREAAQYLRIPILQKLFYDFANPAQLGALKLDEVLDWAAEALNRVDRAAFFATFELHRAVQYFYEPFLEAFDPELRKELGVWYTPPEIVTYMVERIDRVLRSELDIPDGFADPRVLVLDPCCGTGAYLVEVLNKIAATLREKGDDALMAHELKQAAMSRVYGFEILPAPFVISHLQIGMMLHSYGAPFADESSERAGVYLTNALTGWEPPSAPKQHLLFPEMEEERDKAQAVKQHAPILVILGNPPYNGFAGVSPDEEGGLVDEYKRALVSEWGIKRNYLDDLYVRFWRIAERRIVEESGSGVVSFITNFSWLGNPSYVVMRQRLMNEFSRIDIDNMNGDSRETGKLTPEGMSDPSVFSSQRNREGIRVGTAIALMSLRPSHSGPASVRYREFWGVGKLDDLTESLHGGDAPWGDLRPGARTMYSLRTQGGSATYSGWPSLTNLFAANPYLGLNENRGASLFSCDRDELRTSMRRYFDRSASWEQLKISNHPLTHDAARFDAREARDRLLAAEDYDDARITRYLVRPFDVRWCYWTSVRPIWNEPRPAFRAQVQRGDSFLLTRPMCPSSPEGVPVHVSTLLCEQDVLRGHAYAFSSEAPLPSLSSQDTLPLSAKSEHNLTPKAAGYAETVLGQLDQNAEPALLLQHHAVAVAHSPRYLIENAAGIRHDWPRIPLPATRDALLASVELGRRVAALLDAEKPVDAATTGSIRHELRPLGVFASVSGSQLDPSAGDLAVTAGWGHAGKGGATMPGHGRLTERPYSLVELAAFREGVVELNLDLDQLTELMGDDCYDVYLNGLAYWRCVPKRVWTYTIGGYQVIKKWLSYRERPLLGRDLTPDEARYVTEMTRRIAAILLLEPALDANYEQVKADTYDWPHTPAPQGGRR